MEATRVGALLRELETTLGLLNRLADVIRSIDNDEEAFEQAKHLLDELNRRSELSELPKLLLKTYSEVTAALGGIRLSREAIQLQAIDRLKVTHEKISQVSSHTETAAMRIMDGLDRSLGLIDQLSGHRLESDNQLHETLESLRTEVFELFNHLQFQDIIAQQLSAAADLLSDVEGRLQSVANLFGTPHLSGGIFEQADQSVASGTYDHAASMDEAEKRQALADQTVRKALGCDAPADEVPETSAAATA